MNEKKKYLYNSEVMTEFEKLMVESLLRLEQMVVNAQQSSDISKKLDTINKSVQSTSDSMGKFLDKAQNLAADGEEDEEPKAHEPTEEEQKIAKESLLKELNELASKASDEKNYKLAYKIERAIDTILFE